MRPRPPAAAPIASSNRRWRPKPIERRALEIDLQAAIAEGAFEIHYQPLVDLGSNAVTGCEALLRWRHPRRGMVSPADFIPVAEETGLIEEIGDWVLRTACAEAGHLARITCASPSTSRRCSSARRRCR